jgi:hypothetical protein
MAGILKVDQVQSDSNLSFQVAGANVAYMNSTGLQMTGGQIIAGSNTLINSSGLIYANAGIAFPATQNASADANTLDDYEEGTWTPTIPGISSYSTQLGVYVKVGKFVHVYGLLEFTDSGSLTALDITSFPFTIANNNFYPVGALFPVTGFSSGAAAPVLQGTPNSTQARGYYTTDSSGANYNAYNSTALASGINFEFSLSYIATA